VFADEEGHVEALFEGEVGAEVVFKPVEGGAVGGPGVSRGEFFEPGAGGGEEELAAGIDEVWEALQAEEGVGEAAEEVGGVDDVEGAEIRAEMHGVALFEVSALGAQVSGDGGEGVGVARGFLVAAIGEGAGLGEVGGGVDEAL
jgi:hypothetical protein